MPPIGGTADSFCLLTRHKFMKNLLHFLKCLFITGEECEIEITLEWYDLIFIGLLIIYLIYLIWK